MTVSDNLYHEMRERAQEAEKRIDKLRTALAAIAQTSGAPASTARRALRVDDELQRYDS